MKIKADEKRLKNGKVVSIRECLASEALSLLTLIQSYLPKSQYLITQPYEYLLDEKAESLWIQELNTSANSLLLVATYEGRFIGNIDVSGGKRQRTQHTALLGMGMLHEWRNQGLGTALLEMAIAWAKKNPILEKLWLQAYAEHQAAIHLYHKMGFVEEGRQKNFIKNANKYSDNLLMALDVTFPILPI